MEFEINPVQVGIPLPRDVTEILAKAQGGLHAGEPVPPECFYLLIADLGEQPNLIIDKLRTALEAVGGAPFYVKLEGLGTIGGQRPTELYAEAELPAGLKALHKSVGVVVREAGVELAYQRYTPRVVLAEFPEIGQHDLKQIMSFLSRRQSLSAGPFPVTQYCLYALRETEEGTVQETISTYELTG